MVQRLQPLQPRLQAPVTRMHGNAELVMADTGHQANRNSPGRGVAREVWAAGPTSPEKAATRSRLHRSSDKL